MSRFSRAGLSAVAVACVFALAPLTVSASSGANPGNHYGRYGNPGHHYGRLKHRQAPPPAPAPSPKPAPRPSAGGTTHVATQLLHGTGAGAAAAGIPNLAITIPSFGRPSEQAGFSAPPREDGLDWLLLLILPLLAAVWLLLLARATLAATRRRRKVAA